jgi:hypothetical protein
MDHRHPHRRPPYLKSLRLWKERHPHRRPPLRLHLLLLQASLLYLLLRLLLPLHRRLR